MKIKFSLLQIISFILITSGLLFLVWQVFHIRSLKTAETTSNYRVPFSQRADTSKVISNYPQASNDVQIYTKGDKASASSSTESNSPKPLSSENTRIEILVENLIVACESKNQDKIEEHKRSLWKHLREKPNDGELILPVIQDQNNPEVLSVLVGALKMPTLRNNERIETGILEQLKSSSEGSEKRRILATFYSGHPGLSPKTVDALVEQTADEMDAKVMQELITAIGQNATDEYCAPLFAYWVKRDPDPIVRSSALRKLPAYVDNPKMNVELAIDALGDQFPNVRVAAIEVLNESDVKVFEERHFEKTREVLMVEKEPECAKDIIAFMACTWPDKAPVVLKAFDKVCEDDSIRLYAESFIEIIQEGQRDKDLLLEEAYNRWQEKLTQSIDDSNSLQ